MSARGARVCVAHVVTPGNERRVGDFLEEMWELGVPRIRMTPAAPIGAAAREGDWDVDGRELRRTVESFLERRQVDFANLFKDIRRR